MYEGPLLVIEAVERDVDRPSKVYVKVRAGGHEVEAVFDLLVGDMRFIGYVEIPWVLSGYQPALKAVGRAVERMERDDFSELPLDLSDVVLDGDPPNPWLPLDPEAKRLREAEMNRIDLEMLSLELSGEGDRFFVVEVELKGENIVLEGECYVADGTVPLARWTSVDQIDKLTDLERSAVWRSIRREILRRQSER
jgi:hypothetical protein